MGARRTPWRWPGRVARRRAGGRLAALKRSSLLARFAREERAVVAVEFALIAPLLVALYLGSVEVTRGLVLDQKLVHATTTVGDLASREREVDTAQLARIGDVSAAILWPYAPDDLRMRVSSIEVRGPDEDPVLEWWYSETMARPSLAEIRELGRVGVTGSILRVEATTIYHPLGGMVFDAPIELGAEARSRARLSGRVECGDCET